MFDFFLRVFRSPLGAVVNAVLSFKFLKAFIATFVLFYSLSAQLVHAEQPQNCLSTQDFLDAKFTKFSNACSIEVQFSLSHIFLNKKKILTSLNSAPNRTKELDALAKIILFSINFETLAFGKYIWLKNSEFLIYSKLCKLDEVYCTIRTAEIYHRFVDSLKADGVDGEVYKQHLFLYEAYLGEIKQQLNLDAEDVSCLFLVGLSKIKIPTMVATRVFKQCKKNRLKIGLEKYG